MDEDTKTLLAILALIYGSANGVGLFKTSLDDLKVVTDLVSVWLNGAATDAQTMRKEVKKLLGELWSMGVLVYVAMSIVPAVFLGLVVRYGARDALQRIGLGSTVAKTTVVNDAVQGRSPFYWILFVLSLLTTWQLLADYRKGWSALWRWWRWARKQEAALVPRP